MLKGVTIFIIFIFPFVVSGQKQVGLDQYYYLQGKTIGSIVPKLYYLSPKNYYAELRYNYEEVETASFHFGKKIAFKKIPSLEINPVAGILFGKLNGGSAGAIIEINLDKINFSTEPQYVFSFQEHKNNYLYSWSEISYEVLSFFYTGFALQQTKSFSVSNTFEPGMMAGLSIRNFDIPLYCFNPTSSSKNFVLAVNWKWEK